MTSEKFGLSTQQRQTSKHIFARYPQIDLAKIYGSRVKGNYSEQSDIDLIVFGANIDRFTVSSILMDLNDSDIPYLVDLQSYQEIKNRKLK